ncbi:MAG: DNA polymerase ligase N-terminal domain-containing protein, partial [Micromonosporaceae bacterium]
PRDPEHNHLAVRTEDHPMEYLDFAGRIPEGEYGGGLVKIYDRGTYRVEKWRDDEVIVILDGERITGRHVLFHTRGDDWMIHRMDPPEAGWQPLPELTLPMRATRGSLPDTDGWGYEMRWDGVRAISRVSGGQVHLTDPDGEDITSGYPELRGLAEALAPVECVLDGEILGFRDGRPSADALERRSASRQGADQQRSGRSRRRASRGLPGETISYLAYDLLHADGESLLALGYAERRERLAALEVAGEHWQTPPYFPGNGAAAVATSQEQGLSGVVAKRLDSVYRPGKRTRDWLDVPVKRPRR